MLSLVVLPLAGCGTTRSTDTGRTATEQLLISDAIDRAVQTVDFSALKGQTVYLDDSRLGEAVDRQYLVSTLRQHLLASGCALRDKKEDAEFVVEARAGAIGTDRNDLLFGVPSMNVPQILPGQPTPAAIPEIPVAKRRDQRGVAKIAVFAYHRPTGAPVWQSGFAQRESSSNDVWILGAGPFQRGTIYQGTEFAGQAFGGSEETEVGLTEQTNPSVLAEQRHFSSPARLAGSAPPKPMQSNATAAAAPAARPNRTPPEEQAAPIVAAAAEQPPESAGAPAEQSINSAYSQLFSERARPPVRQGLAATAEERRE
jgi:hypothetical protein